MHFLMDLARDLGIVALELVVLISTAWWASRHFA